MRYDADIRCVPERDGRFIAELRDSTVRVASVNAEYDLCHEMTKAGFPDGAIQFWRGSTPSLSFVSVHLAAGWRVSTGDRTFLQLVPRAAAEDFEKFVQSATVDVQD